MIFQFHSWTSISRSQANNLKGIYIPLLARTLFRTDKSGNNSHSQKQMSKY